MENYILPEQQQTKEPAQPRSWKDLLFEILAPRWPENAVDDDDDDDDDDECRDDAIV